VVCIKTYYIVFTDMLGYKAIKICHVSKYIVTIFIVKLQSCWNRNGLYDTCDCYSYGIDTIGMELINMFTLKDFFNKRL